MKTLSRKEKIENIKSLINELKEEANYIKDKKNSGDPIIIDLEDNIVMDIKSLISNGISVKFVDSKIECSKFNNDIESLSFQLSDIIKTTGRTIDEEVDHIISIIGFSYKKESIKKLIVNPYNISSAFKDKSDCIHHYYGPNGIKKRLKDNNIDIFNISSKFSINRPNTKNI
jgi:hypothetical protein